MTRVELGGGWPEQRQPGGIIPIRIGLAVEIGVLKIAVGVVEIERGAILECSGRTDRAADRHLRLLGQPVAHAELAGAFKIIGLFRSMNDDRASYCVAATGASP